MAPYLGGGPKVDTKRQPDGEGGAPTPCIAGGNSGAFEEADAEAAGLGVAEIWSGFATIGVPAPRTVVDEAKRRRTRRIAPRT
jgi:hypothetical protein